jgi:hypothetical protein
MTPKPPQVHHLVANDLLCGYGTPAPLPTPRRERKRSLASTIRAARKAGADRVIADGVVIALSPGAAESANPWDAALADGGADAP